MAPECAHVPPAPRRRRPPPPAPSVLPNPTAAPTRPAMPREPALPAPTMTSQLAGAAFTGRPVHECHSSAAGWWRANFNHSPDRHLACSVNIILDIDLCELITAQIDLMKSTRISFGECGKSADFCKSLMGILFNWTREGCWNLADFGPNKCVGYMGAGDARLTRASNQGRRDALYV